MQGGVKGELNIGKLIAKRASVVGTALRGRRVDGPDGKGAIVEEVIESVWPMVADGRVRPVIGAEFPVERRQRPIPAGLGRDIRESPSVRDGLARNPASQRTHQLIDLGDGE